MVTSLSYYVFTYRWYCSLHGSHVKYKLPAALGHRTLPCWYGVDAFDWEILNWASIFTMHSTPSPYGSHASRWLNMFIKCVASLGSTINFRIACQDPFQAGAAPPHEVWTDKRWHGKLLVYAGVTYHSSEVARYPIPTSAKKTVKCLLLAFLSEKL
jgi:hypothetical protein